MVHITKNRKKNGGEKEKFCNALPAETSKAVMLKVFCKNTNNHQGALKKNGGINISSGTSATMILKSVIFGDGTLNYLRPLYIHQHEHENGHENGHEN
jgi:hypothetical protein